MTEGSRKPSAHKDVVQMRKTLGVARDHRSDNRTALLGKLAEVLLYGGLLRVSQEDLALLDSSDLKMVSQDEETALLLLLLVLELQDGPLEDMTTAITHLGHILLLHNQLGAYAELLKSTNVQLASTSQVHHNIGIASLVAGDVA
eukprot:CAMPEP_0118955196 /NCGR_PEP_ID=MMETSP1169-20130426/59601_1 /TAXON_ID=36882 /ORGANISM="Pyramimonas obovata, Strain CCMP722" /LENGTH=144 /DNA_ID=CAMNT_0006902993 /DNA_START=94 /DNA_END=525 /DNA_ORIENTATION=+